MLGRFQSKVCLSTKASAPIGRTILSSFSVLPNRPHTTDTIATGDRTSINATEISHFDSLASSWWDPHGPSRILHQMNPIRQEFIAACLGSFPSSTGSPALSYLDVGCGGGIFAESAARLANTSNVLAIDPSKEVIAVARLHAQADHLLMRPGKLNYEVNSIEKLSGDVKRQEAFDIVTLFEVIEHVDHPQDFLNSCLPLVKPGGWLILSTIARTWTSWLTTKLVAEDIMKIVPRGTHDWNKYLNSEELISHFESKSDWGVGGGMHVMGVAYVPGLGWVRVPKGEKFGNYFLGIRKNTKTSMVDSA